jgi:hypothetical protein
LKLAICARPRAGLFALRLPPGTTRVIGAL